jgi:hypothetical protein
MLTRRSGSYLIDTPGTYKIFLSGPSRSVCRLTIRR